MATLNSRILFRPKNDTSVNFLSLQASSTSTAGQVEVGEALPSFSSSLKDKQIHQGDLQVNVDHEMTIVSVCPAYHPSKLV
jgi:hypothetical protein